MRKRNTYRCLLTLRVSFFLDKNPKQTKWQQSQNGRYIKPERKQVARRLNNRCMRTGLAYDSAHNFFFNTTRQATVLPRIQDTSRIPKFISCAGDSPYVAIFFGP